MRSKPCLNWLAFGWCVSLQHSCVVKMRIAVIGQSLFGQEVYNELRKDGHTIVGVFTIPDKDGKADPLGEDTRRDAVGPAELTRHRWSNILSVPQQPKQKRMVFLFSNSPAGAWRVRPSQRWWTSTPGLELSSMSCLSAPSLFPWRSSTTLNTAPSSTTPLCCLATGGPLPSTGQWAWWKSNQVNQEKSAWARSGWVRCLWLS